jgi:hypothetical protein
MRVVGQPRRLQRALAHLARLGQPAHQLEGERLDEHHRDDEPPLPAPPGDGDAAVDVAQHVLVALEVVLRPSEHVERVGPGAQLVVGQAIDESDRLLAVPQRGGGRPLQRLGERESGRCTCAQRRIAELAGDVQRGPRALLGRPRRHRVERVDRELDAERGGARTRAVRQLLPCPLETGVRVVVPAEPVLDGGAHGRQLHRLAVGARGQGIGRAQQRRVAALELAGRALRRGECDERIDPARRVTRRQQAQRRVVPACGDAGRSRERLVAGCSQQRDRRVVARLGGLLDVTGAVRGIGAAIAEHRRRA